MGFSRLSVFLVLGAAVALLAVGGCGGGRRVTIPVEGPEIAKTYPTTVEVTNWRGSVVVTADERATRPRIRARNVRIGGSAGRGEPPAMVAVSAQTLFEGGKPILRVVSRPKSETASEVATELEIVVPRVHGATVRNIGGPVELVHVTGPLVVENEAIGRRHGDITVRTGAGLTDPVTLTTGGGTILYQVGPGSTGRFHLTTGAGRAWFSSVMGSLSQVQPAEREYRGVLDGGSNAVVLHSGRGDVRVRVMHNAGTYGPEHWDGTMEWPGSPDWLAEMGETMQFREPE